MKKFFSKKPISEKPVIVEIVEKKESQPTVIANNADIVKCMDCGNRTKLFYDLTTTIQDEGEENDLEGQDLEDRDPIRCVLCRKYTKSKDNEPIQCEDCLTNGTIFYWTGRHKDIILCDDCYKAETHNGADGYESDSFVEDDIE